MTARAPMICPKCGAPIPVGALYCPQCEASSPTEIAEIAETVQERPLNPPRLSIDLGTRMVEVQAALGSSLTVNGLLGRGGFGEVWAAVDNDLGRSVAVKVLRPELCASVEYRERFRREARTIARLRHPNIVPIYHVGESQGLTYFTMPLVAGITLKAALTEPGGIGVDEALRILAEAATALREAHASGIIHRDLKPENVMLEGPQRRVLLMDFGVAKMEEPDREGLTETDTVLGSPEYMSPEQATGRALDARSDIYSLGVVAYRMLAGRLPFDADTPREVLAHHILTPPQPLDQHVSLPGAISDAVMRCLAKSPDQRWASADDFLRVLTAAALRRSLAGPEPAAALPARPAGPAPERARILPGSRRALFVAAALALALVAAAPWPIARWRQIRRWNTAALGIAALYRSGADSLRAVAAMFARGDVTGPQYDAARQEMLIGIGEQIDASYGMAIDDSASWPASTRGAVRAGAEMFLSAGPAALAYALRPSNIAGCRMQVLNDTTELGDEVRGDNCWWRAMNARELQPPVEYFIGYRVAKLVGQDAGLGLAWCRSDADCRIAFLWPASRMVWGSHRPHSGLTTLQLGRRVALTPGAHQMRVRFQDGRIKVWVDGDLVLERPAAADGPYLERPASFHLVVQNGAIELVGPSALGAVGTQR